MCGRFSLTIPVEDLIQRFNLKKINGSFQIRYNAAPSQILPIILNTDLNTLVGARWGIRYSDKLDIMNAQSESVAKNMFAPLLKDKRCLIIADGFYEWHTDTKSKIPYRFTLKNNEPFAFAGIWEMIDSVLSFAIITTSANDIVNQVHHRMPVILKDTDESNWLKKGSIDLLRPYPTELMQSYRISNMVNNSKVDYKEMIIP